MGEEMSCGRLLDSGGREKAQSGLASNWKDGKSCAADGKGKGKRGGLMLGGMRGERRKGGLGGWSYDFSSRRLSVRRKISVAEAAGAVVKGAVNCEVLARCRGGKGRCPRRSGDWKAMYGNGNEGRWRAGMLRDGRLAERLMKERQRNGGSEAASRMLGLHSGAIRCITSFP